MYVAEDAAVSRLGLVQCSMHVGYVLFRADHRTLADSLRTCTMVLCSLNYRHHGITAPGFNSAADPDLDLENADLLWYVVRPSFAA